MLTSKHNPIIKEIAALEKMRKRKQTGHTLIEGFRTLRHAFNNNWEVLSVLYVPAMVKNAADLELIEKCRLTGVRVEEIGESMLRQLSKREGPLGVVAIINWKEKYTLDNLPLSAKPFILVAESIEKPGNLGVLIRSASASGAEAVILCNSLTAFHDPSCIHSSLGSVFTVPCITTTTTECLDWLKKKNINAIVTTPDSDKVYTDQDFTKPTAIIMGNEHSGVSKEFLQRGLPTKIQMHGAMDSLNVSVAGALFLFEVVRQRSISK